MEKKITKKETRITTIKLEKETKSRLDRLKEHERESYNEVIKKMLNLLSIFRKNPGVGNRFLEGIDKAIKERQVYHEIVKEVHEKNKAIEKTPEEIKEKKQIFGNLFPLKTELKTDKPSNQNQQELKIKAQQHQIPQMHRIKLDETKPRETRVSKLAKFSIKLKKKNGVSYR